MAKHFRQLMSVFCLLCAVCLALGFVLPSFAAETKESYHILIISSYDYSYPTVPEMISGFTEGLGDASVNISYEFMDAKGNDAHYDMKTFYSYLSYKIEHTTPFDLVVLLDDTALKFALTYQDALFTDLPILFMGVNDLAYADRAARHDNITGIAEVLDFEDNLDLINDLFPDYTELVVITDKSFSGQGAYAQFTSYATAHPDLVYRTINTSTCTSDEFRELLADCDAGCVLLHLDSVEDGAGHIYSPENAAAFITDHAPDVPLWRVSAANIGNGVLGGISYDDTAAGEEVGAMAYDILCGADIASYPVITTSMTRAYFDQSALDQFHISMRKLPGDAVILNEHSSFRRFYRENMLIMNLILLILLLMIAVIIILIAANRRRERLIRSDFLTKMPNRTYITDQIASIVQSGEPFGLVMIDVDKFKSINDTLGHQAGDDLLCGVADRLKDLPKKDIVVARIGGDEFMGLIRGANKMKAAMLCRTISRVMRDDFESSAGPIHITVSVGCAIFPGDTSHADMVMTLADEALYDVKEHGRNGYRLYGDLKRHVSD